LKEIQIQFATTMSGRAREKYRMLRTNIEFCGIENKTLVFTSCTPEDGKSSTSYQLARTMAEADKKVLLIDADMRRSNLQDRLSLMGDYIGLSHLLIGQNELRECIYLTNVPNFYLMPTGIFPTNPAELLGKKRFIKMLEVVREKFDYVLIDAPPIGSVIDAAVIANHCDGVVIIVSAKKNSRREERLALEQMRMANPNILGVVLNRVERSKGILGSKYQDGYYYHDTDSKKKKKR
jgi:capsular exopolysaccharide synthesis family protein